MFAKWLTGSGCKERGVLKEAVDPRLLYSAEHRMVMHAIRREHGMGVKQVLAVTMNEAQCSRNLSC